MAQAPVTSQNFLKQTNILYLAMIAGIVIFAGVTIFLNQSMEEAMSPELDDSFKLIVPMIAVGAAVAGYYIFSIFIKRISKGESLDNQLSSYRTALIIRYALWDGGCLISVIGYLLTGNLIYLAYLFGLLVLFVLFPPSRNRTISDLNLTPEEEKQLG